MKIRLFGLALALCLLTGCTTINVMTAPGKNIAVYKTAYVQMLPVDEFNLGAAIIREMSTMGFQVVAGPVPANPLPTDIKVEYSYLIGWNMIRFLKSFRIILNDAQTGVVMSVLSYNTPGVFDFRRHNEQARIHDTFEEFRERVNTQ